MKRMFVALLVLMGCMMVQAQDVPKAVLFNEALPGYDAALISALNERLQAAGYSVCLCDANGIAGTQSLDQDDLLVLPNAAHLPADTLGPIGRFLERGGDLLALDAPLGQTLYQSVNGAWKTTDEIERANAILLPSYQFCDFAPGSTASWKRATNDFKGTGVCETVGEGPVPGRRALHVTMDNLTGWDNYGADLKTPFPTGRTLTVFTAKGSNTTRSLLFEWVEKDGSRWMATVKLTNEWRRYVLRPEDFKYWESVPARANTKFNPANAQRFTIGLAFSHTGMMGGPQEFWVSGFGAEAMKPEYESLFNKPVLSPMDTLAPSYKFYEASGVTQLILCERWMDKDACLRMDHESRFVLPKGVVRCMQPRPSGAGFAKQRDWRWIPLIEAFAGDGDWRGVPATLFLNQGGKYAGGQWASFGIEDIAWYKSPETLKLIGEILARMRRGVYFMDAGAAKYTYFTDQQVILGANVMNFGRDKVKDAEVRVSVYDDTTYKEVFSWQRKVSPRKDDLLSVAVQHHFDQWPRDGYRVVAKLLVDDNVVDSVAHDLNVWRPKSHKEYVKIEKGHFVLDGKRWRPNGVNYMPSSGIGTEDGPFFERWMSLKAYDPEIIERDLKRVKAMGLNAISIFCYYEDVHAQNLVDILRRADALGMKVNLSLRHATGFEFPWGHIKEMIESSHLRENDTVFAYDIDWEPLWLKHEHRIKWDGAWEAWVIERYGSVANAEHDWQYPIPRDKAGKVTNPEKKQVETDGEWRRMVAAYRRFLDTLLYKYYSHARTQIQTIDPNHAVSFRMTEAGDPTMRWDGVMAYDFPYLSAAVDILEPEGYGRLGDWEKIKPALFQCVYARSVAPHLPLMWAEAGISAWDLASMTSPKDALDKQGTFLRDYYRMLIESRSDGIFWWWYPGGFRFGENSDYGIINPDGTDRPATTAIRENSKVFIECPDPAPVTDWIPFDRDAQADGITGIYDKTHSDFFKRLDEGKIPGFKMAGTGATSADSPQIAVGNSVCDGKNPAKYLDGYIDAVEVRNASGVWVNIPRGGTVPVLRGKPVRARVHVTNLGEAKWMHCGEGAVSITATYGDTSILNPIKKDVAHFGSITVKDAVLHTGIREKITVTLRFRTEGRTTFGDTFPITLRIK